jgi:hypothetical protein
MSARILPVQGSTIVIEVSRSSKSHHPNGSKSLQLFVKRLLLEILIGSYRFSRSGRPEIQGGGPGPGNYDADYNKVCNLSRMILLPPLRYFIPK